MWIRTIPAPSSSKGNSLQLHPGELPDSFMTNSIFALPYFVAQTN